MKRVINGKIYNTETAIFIANDESSLSMSDYRYYDESLYKTKKGTFFLAGRGHAMTKWATHNGNSSGWGEGIELLSENEALTWCEDISLESEIINLHFTLEQG